jgi:hypothetical protein
MGKKMKKLLARHVIDGTISRDQARAMLGKRPLAAAWRGPQGQGAAAVKSQAPARSSPAFTAKAGPVPAPENAWAARGRADWLATLQGSRDPAELERARMSAASPAAFRTSAELAVLREADKISDPGSREGFRSGLMARPERNAIRC